MRNSHRLAAAATAIAAAVCLAACGSGANSATTATTTGAAVATTTATKANDGVTKITDAFGAACSKIPAEGAGSLNGMANDPVATAASHNPLLTKLVAAVQAAGLVDTLNTQKAITVFAPADPAFAALGDAAFAALAKDPAKLAKILQYHVLPQRLTADDLLNTVTEKTLQGSAVKVTGDKTNMKVNDAPVLCGDIPTGNATVFVIGKVLTPAG